MELKDHGGDCLEATIMLAILVVGDHRMAADVM
jgi:hypothetical protein